MAWENNPYKRKVKSKFFVQSSGPLCSVGNRFDRGSVFRGSHAGDFLKLPGKIVDGSVAQKIGNLGKIMVIFPDKLLSQVDFQPGKIINNTALVIVPE